MKKNYQFKKALGLIELMITLLIIAIISAWALRDEIDTKSIQAVEDNYYESEKILNLIIRADSNDNFIGFLRSDTDCLNGTFLDLDGSKMNLDKFVLCLGSAASGFANKILVDVDTGEKFYKFSNNQAKFQIFGSTTQDNKFYFKFDYGSAPQGASAQHKQKRKMAVNRIIGLYSTNYPEIVTGEVIESDNAELGIVTIEFTY